jgi:capsular polysaccharide biosynthesis protein
LKYGFTIIRPDKLDFKEQVNLFKSATHIAGPYGSGLHNIIFSLIPDKVKLLILASSLDPLRSYYSLERCYGRALYVICGHATTNQSNSPWKISLKEVEAGLKQWLSM